QLILGEIDFHLIARADFLAETVDAVAGYQVTTVDGIAKENPRVKLGDHRLDAGGIERDGSVLARGATAEILAGNYDLVRRDEFVVCVEGNMALRQPGVGWRHAGERVLAEHLVLFRNGRVVREILGRDDLVSIDVVAEDVRSAADDGVHAI